jgi:hypothetical protein
MDAGVYISPEVGLFFDVCGVRALAAAAACFALAGFTGFVSAFSNHAGVGALCLALYVVGHASVCSFVSALSNEQHFSVSNRGKVAGFLVSGFGLSAAVVAQIYEAVVTRPDQVSAFLTNSPSLSLSVCPQLTLCFLCLPSRSVPSSLTLSLSLFALN